MKKIILLITMLSSMHLYSDTPTDDFALLIEAIHENNIESVRELFIKNPNLMHTVSSHPINPFILAVYDGNINMAKLLVENGADVNASMDGVTALHIAPALQTSIAEDITNFLLKNDAEINAIDSKGQTPLMSAVIGGNINIVKVLVENGADVNIATYDGETAISLAAQNRHPDILAYLLQNNF